MRIIAQCDNDDDRFLKFYKHHFFRYHVLRQIILLIKYIIIIVEVTQTLLSFKIKFFKIFVFFYHRQ